MAEKKVIEIEVKTQDAVKSMDALSKSTKEAGKEFDKAATFAERYGEELQPLTTRMGEAEDRLYELANAGQTTTQEYKDLLKSVGDFRKVQISTDMAVDAAATTMGQKLGGALGGVSSGFTAVSGVMGAFGTQSEEVEKALLKVQSAMAIQQGIQGIKESVSSFRELGAVVTNFGTKAVSSFKAMSAANKAFMVTGIGVLLVALGAVVAYWDDISKALGFTTKESEKYAKQQKLITEQAKEQRAEIAKESGAFTQQILRLKNTNAGTKERRDLINEVNKTYGTTLKNLSDETKFQASLNVELASYLEYQKAKYQLQKNEKAIVANLEKQDELTRKLFDSQQKIDKARKDGAGKQKRTLEEGIITYVNVNEAADKSLETAQKTIAQTQIELDKAKGRFENYGKAANDAQASVDKLTNGGKKFVQGSGQTNEKVKNEIDNVDKLKQINDDLVAYYDAIEAERQAKITDAREKELQDAIKMAIINRDNVIGMNIIKPLITIEDIGQYHLTYMKDIIKMNLRFLSGSTVLIGSECKIGKSCEITNSVLLNNVIVGDYCKLDWCILDDCVILPEKYVAYNCFITKKEKGDLDIIDF